MCNNLLPVAKANVLRFHHQVQLTLKFYWEVLCCSKLKEAQHVGILLCYILVGWCAEELDAVLLIDKCGKYTTRQCTKQDIFEAFDFYTNT